MPGSSTGLRLLRYPRRGADTHTEQGEEGGGKVPGGTTGLVAAVLVIVLVVILIYQFVL
jgi:hypothetical protein